MTEQFEEFYKRYEQPEVEPLTVGYSGIDPPLNANSYGLDHECLEGLLGGDDEEHYHLTEEQLRRLIERYNEDFSPRITSYQVVNTIPKEEMTPYEIKGRHIKITQGD